MAYIIWFSEVQIIKFQFFTIKILSFGVVNLIYTANVIFQVTFSVSRMILLPEAELASTVLSYTAKLFQANAWVSSVAKESCRDILEIFQVVLGGTFTDWYRVLRMGTENGNKHSFSRIKA